MFTGKCNVTTFMDPHFFGIVSIDNESKRTNLEKAIEQHINVSTKKVKPQLGEVFIVKDADGIYKRAIVETLEHDRITCWLLDYGKYYNTNTFYKIPNDFDEKSPPLSFKAGLINIVGLSHSYETGYSPSLKWTAGASHLTEQYIKEADAVVFCEEEKIDNVCYGQLILTSNGIPFNLVSKLIQEHVATTDRDMFKEAIKNLNKPSTYDVNDSSVPNRNLLIPQSVMEYSVGIGRGSRRDKIQKDTQIEEESKDKFIEKWLKTSTPSTCSQETSSRSNSLLDSDDSIISGPIKTRNEKIETVGNKMSMKNLRKCILDMHQSESPCSSKSGDNSSISSTGAIRKKNVIDAIKTAQSIDSNVSEKLDDSSIQAPRDVSKKDEIKHLRASPDNKTSQSRDLKLVPAGVNLSSRKSTESKVILSKSNIISKETKNVSSQPLHEKNVSFNENANSGKDESIKSGSVQSGSIKSGSIKSGSVKSGSIKSDNYSDGEIPTYSVNNINNKHTLGCACSKCKEWNTNEFDTPIVQFKKIQNKDVNVTKPVPLFKTNEDAVNSVKTMAGYTNVLSKANKAIAPKILVHGSMIPQAVKLIADLPYAKPIHDALKMLGYKTCKSIQSYVCPCLMRNMNVCMVHSSKTGKTMSYIPAISSFILHPSDRYRNLPKGNGPIAIIICPGAQRGEEVLHQFRVLMNKVKSKNLIYISEAFPPLVKKVMKQIETRCDILIATPMTILTLLASNSINFKRLCHLIIEDFDKILNNQRDHINTILRVTQEMMNHRTCSNQIQFVCTAEHWSKPLENIMKDLNSFPVVCIGAHMQSAFYGRADIQMIELKEEFKLDRLTDILRDMYQVYKTVVVCKPEEITPIKEHLQLQSISLVVAESKMSGEDFGEVEMTWCTRTNGEHIVLLCTDDVLHTHLTITNASLLVNYSIPETWSGFNKRFAILLDNYKSPLIAVDDPYNCKIYIFVDQSCKKQFPRLAEMFSEMGAKLPKQFIDYVQVIKQNMEELKIASNTKLCKNIKLYGSCYRTRCNNRHLLSSKIDINTHLPQAGTIKYKILEVKHINRFIIKLLEYTDLEGNVHRIDDKTNYIARYMKMKLHEFATYIEVGNIYMYKINNVQSRCIVKTILYTDSVTKLPSQLEIYQFDLGISKTVSASELFELPDEIKTIPPIGVELYLTNIIPPNSDTYWTQLAKEIMIDSLEANDYMDEDVYCTSNIILQLDKSILVDEIRIQTHLTSVNTTVNKYLVKKTLLQKKLIEISTSPLDRLRDLCKKCQIELPDVLVESTKPAITKQIKPQWAHLDDRGYNEIYFSSGVPSLFYVRLVKFQKLFDAFQKNIQEEILKPTYFALKVDHIIVGNCYLAQDPGGEDYCRVIVAKIVDDVADCFYVDFGDWNLVKKSELKYIRDDMITKIPFQAVECRLYGVYPTNETWTEAAIDLLYTYCFEPDSDIFRSLYTCKIKLEQTQNTEKYRYAVLLLDYTQSKPTLINKLLLECGLGTEVEHESLDKDFRLPDQMVSSDEEEVDDDIDEKEYTLNELQTMKAAYANSDGFSVISNTEEVCEVKDDEVEDDSGLWDFEIIDSEDFLKELAGVFKDVSRLAIQEKPIQKAIITGETTASAPVVNDFSIPNVTWYQTETQIKLEIKLLDLKDYELKLILGRALNFSAFHNDKKYKLVLQLYERVDKTFKHVVTGQVLRVSLTKVKPIEWPRLIISTDIMKHIKFNVDMLDLPEDKAPKLLFIGEDRPEELVDLDDVMVHELGSDYDSTSDINDSDDGSD